MIKIKSFRKTILIVFAFLIKTSVISQVAFSDWIVTSGKKGWDIVNSIACDSTGSIYITGSNTDLIISGKSGYGNVNNRKYDFLTKYDSSGNLVWSKKLKLSIPGYGDLLSLVNNNQMIIVGGCDPSMKNNKLNLKKIDFFLCSLDKTGKVEWTQTFSGNRLDFFSSLDINPITNQILLGGYFYDTLFVQGKIFISSGMSDGILLKFDSKGILESSQQIGGKGEDKISAITIDKFGNAFIAGTFQKKIRYADTSILSVTNQGETGVFLVKYSVSNQLMSANLLCSGKNTLVNSIALKDNLCFVTGSFHDVLTLNNQQISSRGGDDIFLICIDNNTKIKWYKQIGGAKKDRASDIRVDGNEIILSGSFCSKLFVDNISITSKKESSDVFILSFDKNGNIIWIRQFGGKNDDYPKSMAITPEHYIYVTGSYRDTLNIGEKIIQSKGDEDIFIARLENCSLLSPKFKRPESFCKGNELTLDAGKGFDSYNWNNGQSSEQLFKVYEGGYYSLIRIFRNGCVLYDTVEVKENPIPLIFIAKDTTIFDTSSLVLHVSGKYKEYLWSNGKKDSVNVIHGYDYNEGKNTLWLQVTDTNGCQGYAELVINVKKSHNLNSESLSNSCIIFPNPTDDVLNIYFTNSLEDLELKIFSQMGIEVASKSVTNYMADSPIIFSLAFLSPGTYVVEVRTNNGFAIKKIVLQ